MSDRFSNLKSTSTTKKQPYKKPSRHESDINSNPFKNRKVHESKRRNDQKDQKDQKESRSNSRNIFVKNLRAQFNVNSENFPDLSTNNTITDTSEKPEKLDYLEKIKLHKDMVSEKRLVPSGWIIISPNSFPIQHTSITKSSKTDYLIMNPDYNPMKSKLILIYRQNQREELNDILGDISPYWNMNLYDYGEDDDDEYDSDYDYDDYDEDEYLEDW